MRTYSKLKSKIANRIILSFIKHRYQTSAAFI